MDFVLSKNMMFILVAVAVFSAISLVYICFTYFLPIDKYLKSGASISGMVDLALACSASNADDILSKWDLSQKTAMRNSLYIDFFFIVAYVALLTSLGFLVSSYVHESARSIGMFISVFPVFAGVFDVLENVLLLRILASERVSDFMAFAAGLSAIFKFILVGITVFYIIITFIGLLVFRHFFAWR